MEIKVKKEIAAKPETVFELISKGQLFFSTGILPGSFKMDFKEGGEFSFEWVSGSCCKGVFEKIIPPQQVSFTWSTDDREYPAEDKTMVDIQLESIKTGTCLTLIHSGFETPKSHASHEEGWTTSLNDFASEAKSYNDLGNYAWDRFNVIMNIRSTPEKLFKRWATASGKESFFIEKMKIKSPDKTLRMGDEIAHANDRFDWTWIHGGNAYGRFLNVEKDRSISFTFGESEVSVWLNPHENGTWLHIEQSKIPTFEAAKAAIHVNCRTGWTYFATVLKTLEENGIDIRDKNPKTAGSLAWLNGFPQPVAN